MSANSERQLNYSSLAGVLIMICITILKTKHTYYSQNSGKFDLKWTSSFVRGKKKNITVNSKGNNDLLYLIISPHFLIS